MIFKSYSIAVAYAAIAVAQNGPSVKTSNGTLQGAKCPSTAVNSFFNIPYAQPPVGDLRFAPPQPYNQTYTTRDATQAAPSCMQFNQLFAEAGPQSEDW